MFDEKRVKILVVDDEAPIRQTLKEAIEDEGYQVLTAEGGEQALQMAARDLPGLILLDIWMPGALDGLQTLKRLGEQGLAIPVVMISGHGTIETAVKATRLGAWDFLEKPLSTEKVIITIQNVQAAVAHVVLVNFLMGAENIKALHEVSKLSNLSGPRVGTKYLHRRRPQNLHRVTTPMGNVVAKML